MAKMKYTKPENLNLPIEIEGRPYFMVYESGGITTESVSFETHELGFPITFFGEYEICARKGNKYYSIKIQKNENRKN